MSSWKNLEVYCTKMWLLVCVWREENTFFHCKTGFCILLCKRVLMPSLLIVCARYLCPSSTVNHLAFWFCRHGCDDDDGRRLRRPGRRHQRQTDLFDREERYRRGNRHSDFRDRIRYGRHQDRSMLFGPGTDAGLFDPSGSHGRRRLKRYVMADRRPTSDVSPL